MAKKTLKWIGITLVAALVLIQLYRPSRNADASTTPTDITLAYQVPANITEILHKACYDCHSNNTNYPWYFNVQPVAMWMDDHVAEGKDELNFSEFGNFKTKRKLKKLKEIVSEVEENEMPLKSYTWIHKEAILTPIEKQLLIDWAKGLSLKIGMEPDVVQ